SSEEQQAAGKSTERRSCSLEHHSPFRRMLRFLRSSTVRGSLLDMLRAVVTTTQMETTSIFPTSRTTNTQTAAKPICRDFSVLHTQERWRTFPHRLHSEVKGTRPSMLSVSQDSRSGMRPS